MIMVKNTDYRYTAEYMVSLCMETVTFHLTKSIMYNVQTAVAVCT